VTHCRDFLMAMTIRTGDPAAGHPAGGTVRTLQNTRRASSMRHGLVLVALGLADQLKAFGQWEAWVAGKRGWPK
jgi:hypothetical protein